ncbi:MAG: hypothetical protein GAK29_01500 [Acinetobacter bereziniae]|uniref:Exonuclease domain-containing protein n=1 Tax=Acinetobacter bereziniae TaxID=106648 RepID=A0A833UQK6_ACIBZ|nr:MAG: hypothetical protein GAK29_01500 [Acinetobacter bereziniae]
MSALILDTETNSLNGYPIEIAYVPCSFERGVLEIHQKSAFDQYFSCPEPIELGSLATHHILESDIADKPSYEVFRLPENTVYLIGHNIDYDIQAIKLCDSSINVKGICTLALESGQEIFIVMPTCILRTKYDPEHGDICLSVANGFAQLDEENAKLQLQAFGKTFGYIITEIDVKDGFSEKPKKARNTKKSVEQESPQVVEKKPVISIESELQLYLDGLRACTTLAEIESTLFNVDKVGFSAEQKLEITMAKERKIAEFNQPKAIESQENISISEDTITSEDNSPALHPYQSVVDELMS